MSDYKTFTIEEFAMDALFRKWVLSPDPQSLQFWNQWLLQNPDQHRRINQARALVLALNIGHDSIQDKTMTQDIEQLVKKARYCARERKASAFSFSSTNWRIAATFLILCGVAWLYFTIRAGQLFPERELHVIAPDTRMLTRINNSEGEMTILLSDNSVATLMKGSKLTYPSRFSKDERKIFLSGEAFFDITKDPKRPFLVFANETVTKVLGTSFRVKAFEQDSDVMVVVKTGRVSVYPQKDYELLSRSGDHEVNGVVLSPNQQVVFRKKDNRLEKGIVANPGMLSISSDQKELIFDEKPVAEVLSALENIYGIEIVFDSESLSTCLISTQFNEENLKQRMSVICQAIGATYEMIDGQIIVNSKGCGS